MEVKQAQNGKVAFVYADGSKRVFSTGCAGKIVWEHLGDGAADEVRTRENEALIYTGSEPFIDFMRKNQRRILRTTWK